MKVYCLIVGFWDQDLMGIYANEESAKKAAEQFKECSIDEWEVEDLINKEIK